MKKEEWNMIDFKQLQYFLVCAETGSFSKAAERLYTTQPNVSKIIRMLENEMNAELFKRSKNGIELTDKGRHVYEHAGKVMDEVELLQDFSDAKEETWLRIACNPSSKLADIFVDFYQRNKETNLHYRIYSTGIQSVFRRVRDDKEDVGFVFIGGNREEEVKYSLIRYHLEFVPLKEVPEYLFLGGGLEEKQRKEIVDEKQPVRLIQSYYEEVSSNQEKTIQDEEGHELGAVDSVIITNSDYITERILKKTDLGNISGGNILRQGKLAEMNGQGIPLKERKVVFGYVYRKDEKLSDWAEKFIAFVKTKV